MHVTRDAWNEIKNLPGNMRQRVRKAIDALADDPRPPKSKALDVADVPAEVRRLRIERWRIVYAVSDDELLVDVLAVRKRPPYNYEDLASLLKDLP